MGNTYQKTLRIKRFASLLRLFAIFYPLVLFPGALWFHPNIVGTEELTRALEQYQLFPKLIFLLLTGLLGLISAHQIAWQKRFVQLILLYFSFAILSIFLSRDFSSFSLVGPNARLDGAIYLVAFTAFAIASFQLLNNQTTYIPSIAKALLIGGVIQSIVIIFQRLGLDFIGPLVRWMPYTHPVGTLSHDGMAAGFLLPLIFVGIWLAHIPASSRETYLVSFGTLIVSFGLAATSNRSAFYTLFFVLLALNIYYRNPKTLLVSLLAIAGFCLSMLLPQNQEFQKSFTQTTTLQTRFLAWKMAAELIPSVQGQPIFGGGTEAFIKAQAMRLPIKELTQIFAIEYQALGWPPNSSVNSVTVINKDLPARDQSLRFTFFQNGRTSTRDFGFSFDKAHNLVLDKLLPYGGVAAVAYTLLYLFPIISLLRSKLSFAETGLVWSLVSAFIYYLAWFSVIQSEPIHILLVAMVWALLPSRRAKPL